VIKLDERKIFTGSTTSSAPANFFTRMLMRDLFDVANLLVYIRFMVANVVRFYAIALVFLNLYPTVICEI